MTTADLLQSPTTTPPPLAVIPLENSADAPRPWGKWTWWAGQFVVMICIVVVAIGYGLKLRRDMWFATTDIHFRITMNSAIRWGQRANKPDSEDVYQAMVEEFGDDPDTRYEGLQGALALDYPPLRLMVISAWEKWTEKEYPIKPGRRPLWNPDYEFTRPMLWLNNACEIAGSAAMFLLVHYWLRRCRGAPLKPWLELVRGCWPALFAALLVWFNPAVIFNSHGYPQWDVWILAPFLLAIYFGLLDMWLLAGICIGFVAMGKGQILLVTPALIVWQLCIGRPGAVLRLVVGIMLSAGVIASPWLLNNDPSYHWMKLVLIASTLALPLFFFRGWSRNSLIIHGTVLVIFMILVLWPWLHKARPPFFAPILLGTILSIIAARFLPRKFAPTWMATIATVAVFACVRIFNTSMDWYTVGIKGPTHNWQKLYWCKALNLGAILQENFGWEWHQEITLTDYFPWLFGLSPAGTRDAITAILLTITLGFAGAAWLQRKQKGIIYLIIATATVASVLGSFIFVPMIQIWFVKLFDPDRPMRYLMIGGYVITLVVCGIAMAVHHRRKSPMFFFAMVAPWVLMYALLPQMQNRYLVWACAFSAATASFSLDGFLLYLLLIPISIADTALDMMDYVKNTPTSQKWLPLLTPIFPDMAWGVMLIAGIWLYLAVSPWRGRKLATDVLR